MKENKISHNICNLILSDMDVKEVVEQFIKICQFFNFSYEIFDKIYLKIIEELENRYKQIEDIIPFHSMKKDLDKVYSFKRIFQWMDPRKLNDFYFDNFPYNFWTYSVDEKISYINKQIQNGYEDTINHQYMFNKYNQKEYDVFTFIIEDEIPYLKFKQKSWFNAEPKFFVKGTITVWINIRTGVLEMRGTGNKILQTKSLEEYIDVL